MFTVITNTRKQVHVYVIVKPNLNERFIQIWLYNHIYIHLVSCIGDNRKHSYCMPDIEMASSSRMLNMILNASNAAFSICLQEIVLYSKPTNFVQTSMKVSEVVLICLVQWDNGLMIAIEMIGT